MREPLTQETCSAHGAGGTYGLRHSSGFLLGYSAGGGSFNGGLLVAQPRAINAPSRIPAVAGNGFGLSPPLPTRSITTRMVSTTYTLKLCRGAVPQSNRPIGHSRTPVRSRLT